MANNAEHLLLSVRKRCTRTLVEPQNSEAGEVVGERCTVLVT